MLRLPLVPRRHLSAMTLCLSGVCERGDAILSVFDRQLTLSGPGGVLAQSETAIKGARVNARWAVFFAGDDIRLVGFIIDRIKNRVLARSRVTLSTMQKTVVEARNAVHRECIETEILGRFGITLPNFLALNNRPVQDRALYDGLLHAVLDSKAGCDFLIAGFGARPRMAHIVSILDGTYGANHDREGVGAVGSGETVAHQTLSRLGYSKGLSAKEAAYVLCAAKFSAEDQYVGRGTYVSLFRRNGSVWVLDAEKVRGLWNPTTCAIPAAKMPAFRMVTRPSGVKRPHRAKRSTRKSPKHGR